jgi:hypothetical protein
MPLAIKQNIIIVPKSIPKRKNSPLERHSRGEKRQESISAVGLASRIAPKSKVKTANMI